MFGSYRRDDVTLLLKDITGQIEPLGTQARERKIQSGTPYYEMLPIEYEPTPAYLHAYQDALTRYAGITAEAVGSVARQIWEQKGDRTALVSLARAGTPGTYQVPQPMVESMYVPQWRGTGAAEDLLIVRP